MYKKVFKVACREDLLFELPGEYLNKEIEAIAFQLAMTNTRLKRKKRKKPLIF